MARPARLTEHARPVPAPPAITPELLGGLIERAGRADYPQLEAQLRSSGYCARPVRLRGQIETCDGTGRRRVWSTDTEPDGVLRKACGNRREAVCGPCAGRYRQDAYHLIAAGLRGGKGVPDTVSTHPAVFMTLTAPSFGLVHTRPLGPDGTPRRCRPRRDAPTCPHGVRLSCVAIHDEADPCLGEPLCPDCFDYAGAVVWNNTLGELWRRTTIYIPRALARLNEITQKQLRSEVRLPYVKVAEYQRRGLVHVHVLIRLDRAMPKYRAEEIKPPPAGYDAKLLADAVRAGVADVSAPVADELGGGRVRWGDELDVRALTEGEERGEVAGYLAKYATKSTEQAGGLLHRIDPDQVECAPVREHVRRYLRTAFELHTTATKIRARTRPPAGGLGELDVETDWNISLLARRVHKAMSHDERIRVRLHGDGAVHLGKPKRIAAAEPARNGTTLTFTLDSGAALHLGDVASIGPAKRRARRRDPRLAACAHAFGYRGHCLTKSRRYSTTFKALREARQRHVHEQILAHSRDATQRALAAGEERVATFVCAGIGHLTAADEYLAASEAVRARERRRIAREERCGAPGEHSTATAQVGRWVTGESPVLVGEFGGEAVHDG